jgi:hypothetical protein
MPRDDVNDLARMQRFKKTTPIVTTPLGEELISFYKHTVQKRQTKLAKIAECWVERVPESLCDHCVLHSLSRGTLTVLVDSAVHLYELKQLLLAGVQDQLLLMCKSAGLRKVMLKPGRPDNS